MPPLPPPKHHVCPQTLSSFGWCLLAPLAASWPLFCCKLVVLISWPQLTASTISRAASVVIIKITQRSDSSATGNGQKSMQFHWKDGRGRWILWRNLCSIWPSPSLSSSCFKKSDLKNIPLLILNRPPCPIVLVYSNFFIISEQETQTILFSNPPPPPADDENTYSIWLFPNQTLY